MRFLAIKLNLTPIVDVNVNLSLKSAARKGFNLGLIIGPATVIPTAERVRVYTSADAMLTDGFKATDAEYKAALLYFNAPTAPDRVAIGTKAADETVVVAATACRAANSEWWGFTYCGATAEEITAQAAWAESAQPSTFLMYTTNDAAVLDSAGAATDIFIALKAKKYRRSFGQYCSKSDTPDAIASIMGYAMGANTGTADSAFTLAYKTEVGVTVEALTEAQVDYITGNNGNVYVNRADSYDVFQQGLCADGSSFDEILNLDMLVNDIQLNVMDLLYQTRKVPQTESGVASIVNVINTACKKYVNTGFITPGKWNGSKCLGLATGDTLPDGYLVQSEAIDDQSQADRDARKAPPIYVCCKLAGAIEFVTIQVNVNR